jgi:hypothetical protein
MLTLKKMARVLSLCVRCLSCLPPTLDEKCDFLSIWTVFTKRSRLVDFVRVGNGDMDEICVMTGFLVELLSW